MASRIKSLVAELKIQSLCHSLKNPSIAYGTSICSTASFLDFETSSRLKLEMSKTLCKVLNYLRIPGSTRAIPSR